MFNITVTSMVRIAKPKPNRGGSTVLAYYDCEANGFEFHGCAFVRTSRNGLTAWLPKIEAPASAKPIAVNFVDERIRSHMVRAVQEVYRALGGKDGEYLVTDDERSAQNAIEARERVERRRLREQAEGDADGLARFMGEAA